jgi:hypothetical protein
MLQMQDMLSLSHKAPQKLRGKSIFLQQILQQDNAARLEIDPASGCRSVSHAHERAPDLSTAELQQPARYTPDLATIDAGMIP